MKDLLEKFRERLSEFRYQKIGTETSIHVNAMEIVLCLSEYAIFKDRKIKKDEMQWFNGGLQLEYVFAGSDWEDLVEYYYKLEREIIKNGLVEN